MTDAEQPAAPGPHEGAPIILPPPQTPADGREYRVVGALPFMGHGPSTTFRAHLSPADEARHIAAHHIEPVDPDGANDTEGA